MSDNILIIKLSAIGDFVQATGAIAAIRAHHADAHITLMTTKPMKPLAEANPNVDEVIYHVKPKWWQWQKFKELKQQLQGFERIYDLQCNDRTAAYFKLAGRPEGWCGTARQCTFWQRPDMRSGGHSGDFLPAQLALAGITTVPAPDIGYAAVNARPKLREKGVLVDEKYPAKLVILIPGSSITWPGKRWPHFANLAQELKEKGYTVWLCGGPDETELLENISVQAQVPHLLGLSLAECLSVFQAADYVIGNDTGPMHMAAAVGAAGTVLFGPASDYKRHAPRSVNITVLHDDEHIGNLTVANVLATLP